mmetsp:Transcript_18141/g.42292  ORF Transcript_18141/g.42292 Transcript_18141/m.42292 type:complete len:302 (+) Transcript_18141:367-1272(+)
MKLSSTILASSLASAALIGSAAEVPPHGGHGGNPFKKKDIEPRAVTTAWNGEIPEIPAVRGLRGTAKLPKMTARELHRPDHRIFRDGHRRYRRRYDCGSIDLILSSGDSNSCYDEAKEEVEEVFTSVDVSRVSGSSSDEKRRQYFVNCGRNRFDREINNLLIRIDDDLDDSCGTYSSGSYDRDGRDVVNSDGRTTCGSIDLVPVESIPTSSSSGDVPSGNDLDDCFDGVAEAVVQYFPKFEAVNLDTDGMEDGPREFYVDCNRQRTDREINKVLLEIDFFINTYSSDDTCGSYTSEDCETC